jgi:ABC-type transporter Mla subunit MlaD
MINSIPGYFVGIGLLLTFIGLVLALDKAAAAVSSNDAGGMQIATRQLLQVATFKFATSIAGLGSSILLSLLFRVYMIFIEGALDSFNRAVEDKLRYMAPQSITAEMNDTLSGQLTELKQINSADFFARMGEKISPQIQAAFSTAIAPVTTSLDEAISRLTDQSQSGMSELLTRFTDSVQGGAGVELRELAHALTATQSSLSEVQRNISGSGADFGRSMSEAAENLNRLIVDAGKRLGDSSEQSRAALVEVVQELRETFERANRKVDEDLGHAAAGASAKVEGAMGRVLDRLEGQIEAFGSGLGGYQESMSGHLDETQTKVAAAQVAAVGAIGEMSNEVARALQAGLAEALRKINEEVERFAAAMQSSENALAAQASSLRESTVQSRAISDAFGKTSEHVRAASTPLIQSGQRIAGAAEKMTETIARSVTSLEAGNVSSKQLADALVGHIQRASSLWDSYATRFDKVELGAAVAILAKATQEEQERVRNFASEVDQSFGTAISRLNPFLNEINENTKSLEEAVSDLRDVLTSRAAE